MTLTTTYCVMTMTAGFSQPAVNAAQTRRQCCSLAADTDHGSRMTAGWVADDGGLTAGWVA